MTFFNFVKNLVFEKEGIRHYRQRLSECLLDQTITADEERELESIEKKYNLSASEIHKLRKSALSAVFKTMVSDQRITQQEIDSLKALIIHFGLEVTDIKFEQSTFNKYYSLGLIENGSLPKIENDCHGLNVVFKKNEILHFGAAAVLRKLKRVTTRISYAGPSVSIPIMKGVRYRVGSMQMSSNSKEVLIEEDRGAFYITSQRVGYLGARKQFSFPFTKIQSFDLRPDGLYMFKDGKEAPYIVTLDDYEVPCAMVSLILNRDEV